MNFCGFTIPVFVLLITWDWLLSFSGSLTVCKTSSELSISFFSSTDNWCFLNHSIIFGKDSSELNFLVKSISLIKDLILLTTIVLGTVIKHSKSVVSSFSKRQVYIFPITSQFCFAWTFPVQKILPFIFPDKSRLEQIISPSKVEFDSIITLFFDNRIPVKLLSIFIEW